MERRENGRRFDVMSTVSWNLNVILIQGVKDFKEERDGAEDDEMTEKQGSRWRSIRSANQGRRSDFSSFPKP